METTTINSKIKKISHKTYHGANMDIIEFDLHGLKYGATKEWDNKGNIIRCEYYRTLPNEYYDTIATLYGETSGMNNIPPICNFGDLPVDIFDSIAFS